MLNNEQLFSVCSSPLLQCVALDCIYSTPVRPALKTVIHFPMDFSVTFSNAAFEYLRCIHGSICTPPLGDRDSSFADGELKHMKIKVKSAH